MIKLKSLLLEKTLYHGTVIDNVPSIEKYGLIPGTGNFVSDAYGEYEDAGIELPELVFATEKSKLSAAVTAATHHIGKKLNKNFHDVSDAEFFKYAVIIKIYDGEEYFKYREKTDALNYADEHPPQVEPGDYYSEDSVGVDEFLTGNSMVRLLKRYNLWPRPFGEIKRDKTYDEMRDFLVKFTLNKKDVELSKQEIIDKIKKLSPKDLFYWYNRYQREMER
jgi:hypothetical protein